jgi:hypothetical protein
MPDLASWLDRFSAPEYLWFVKRLSGNDTLATGSPYSFRLSARKE